MDGEAVCSLWVAGQGSHYSSRLKNSRRRFAIETTIMLRRVLLKWSDMEMKGIYCTDTLVDIPMKCIESFC